uniref:Assembly factor for spindle microtubules n=1 Tax=Catagonus wagneri TaxID=51154 RepID=A0A8C3VKB6_9CETA
MATRLRGRGCWEWSPPERRPPAGPRGPGAEEGAASPPVLSLSHFCRSPFLCFGDVRLGTSRTLPLALDNPNEEVANVRLSRVPAAEQGFSVRPSAFVLQPKEKIVISVTWTPLKGGRVREMVTFLVNDILKHQAILLGNAEEQKKKKKYKKMKKATLIIQSHLRAYISAKKVLASYQETRSAVIFLQSAYRGMRARRTFLHILTSVIKIQAYYRAYVFRKKFLRLKHAAIKLQSFVRMSQTRRRYLHLKAAALQREERRRVSCITLQAFVRGYLVRKQMRLERRAAVSLQSYFRMRKVRLGYLQTYKAAVVVQNYYRAHRARVSQRKDFLQVKRAATCLQAACRGYKVRQLIKQQSAAALKIQAAFRGYSQRKKYRSVLRSTLKIQRWYRTHKAVSDTRAHFLKTRAAAISLQSAFRGWKVRKQVRREQQAAVKIQSAFRMAKAQKEFRLFKKAACTLQQHLRAWAAGRRQCAEYAARAACLIQMHYRAYSTARRQHRLYLQIRAAVVTLQSAYRGLRVRKALTELRKAATAIQSRYRAYQAQKQFAAYRAAAVLIQRWYRGTKTANCQRREYLTLKKAVVTVQAVYRGVRVRTRVQRMHTAATLIKATFRMQQARRRYQQMRTAAVVIQRRYRAHRQGEAQRARYLTTLKAVSILQASLRGARARQRLRELHTAATLIQAHYRRYRQQAYYTTLKKVTKMVQQKYRRWFRARLQQKRLLQKYHGVLNTPREAQEQISRQNRAASVIQRAVRRFLLRRKQEKFNDRIIKIQALWRGYSWRKRNDCAKMKAIRQRLHCINKELREENKLYQRAALAVHGLLTHKYLSAVLEALKHLEVVTRLSSLCCENMAQSGAIAKIFVLIRSCNRSVPCMEVIGYAVQVLLNVAKYEKTTSAVYDVENSVDTLLELLHTYQEKPGDKVADRTRSIFTKTCCLLAVLLKTTNRASDVRSRSKVVDRIYNLYKLAAHKHRVNTERILCKQRKNPSLSLACIPETPVRTRTVSRLKPDWVLRKDNVEESMNPLKALQMLMDTLGTPYR